VSGPADVAWIAPRFAGEGVATPWYDTSWDSPIDTLYSPTTLPARVVYWAHYDQPGSHYVGLQVAGTVGRPWVAEDGFAVLRSHATENARRGPA
jgi:hypothetical protein